MAAYSLPRGVQRDTRRLREALFGDPEPGRIEQLTSRIEELEAKLRAIEEHPDIDDRILRAAVTHTRLVCTPEGYAVGELDAPPPAEGATVEHEGAQYTVWQLRPSPFPGDLRRCAVLV